MLVNHQQNVPRVVHEAVSELPSEVAVLQWDQYLCYQHGMQDQ